MRKVFAACCALAASVLGSLRGKDATVTVVSPLDHQVVGWAVTDEGGRYKVSVEGNQFTLIASIDFNLREIQ
jgi:hypothetical protein